MFGKIFTGFIVNIHDPLNFDIDILDIENVEFLSNVISNEYSYQDENFHPVKASKAFRCRLNGISYRTKRKLETSRQNKFFNDIRKGKNWVKIKIFGVDAYSRLLVEIFDPITEESFNNKLISSDFGDIFHSYIFQSSKNGNMGRDFNFLRQKSRPSD